MIPIRSFLLMFICVSLIPSDCVCQPSSQNSCKLISYLSTKYIVYATMTHIVATSCDGLKLLCMLDLDHGKCRHSMLHTCVILILTHASININPRCMRE